MEQSDTQILVSTIVENVKSPHRCSFSVKKLPLVPSRRVASYDPPPKKKQTLWMKLCQCRRDFLGQGKISIKKQLAFMTKIRFKLVLVQVNLATTPNSSLLTVATSRTGLTAATVPRLTPTSSGQLTASSSWLMSPSTNTRTRTLPLPVPPIFQSTIRSRF